jgi:hypothetical protein
VIIHSLLNWRGKVPDLSPNLLVLIVSFGL